MSFSIGFVQRCAAGETVCGDALLIEEVDGGLLVGVIDGLGHGPHAHQAAEAFIASVRSDMSRSVGELMAAAHTGLVGTRGAAAAVLRIDEVRGRVTFSGVGNIEAHSVVAEGSMRPVCAPGVVGSRLRKQLPFEYSLPDRALIALCSDGISSRVHLADYAHLEPQAIAEAFLAEHGKPHDDATCVVILRVAEEPA